MERVKTKLYGDYNPWDNLDTLPFDPQGWDSNSPVLTELFITHRPKLVVEIGVWKGGSAAHMASVAKKLGIEGFEIICIDTFLGSEEHWTPVPDYPKHLLPSYYMPRRKNGRPMLYEVFMSNMLYWGHEDVVTPFPIDSVNGLITLKNLGVVPDGIYIDAGHDADSVTKDIKNSLSILRSGGILFGDDAFAEGVIGPARELLPGVEVDPREGKKWYWVKP